MGEEDYMAQLSAVAEKINEWGAAEEVLDGIEGCTRKPKIDTAGATAIMIPLTTVDAEML